MERQVLNLEVKFEIGVRTYRRKLTKAINYSDINLHVAAMIEELKKDAKFYHKGEV